jgi:predicted ATPase
MLAHGALGVTSHNMGEFLLAKEHLEIEISLYDRERHRSLASRFIGLDRGVNCLSYTAHTLWYLGYPDQSLSKVNEALALAEWLSHPHSLAFAEFFVGRLHQLRGDAPAAQEAAERLIALSTEHGFTFWLAQARIGRGAAMAAQGRNEEGIAQMREGLAALHALTPRPQYLCLLAKACIETGRLDDGIGALTEALAIADEHENRNYEAETYRIKGELLLAQKGSNAAEAHKCFERALEIARKQHAKSWELRATTSLARLLASQGRRDEARAMLADIYKWFTEGFDTADLKDAKALLAELGT